MEEKPGQWNKVTSDRWVYITNNYARLYVTFAGDSIVNIGTDGMWSFTKTYLDELIDALTHVREEVYGKR